MSLKLLPILGVPSLPSRFDFAPRLLGLNLANSARCLGLSGPGPIFDGFGTSLAELANDELTSTLSDLVGVSRFELVSARLGFSG